MRKYCACLEVKKDIFLTAKNKTEARKKIKKKLEEKKGSYFVEIVYLEESYV